MGKQSKDPKKKGKKQNRRDARGNYVFANLENMGEPYMQEPEMYRFYTEQHGLDRNIIARHRITNVIYIIPMSQLYDILESYRQRLETVQATVEALQEDRQNEADVAPVRHHYSPRDDSPDRQGRFAAAVDDGHVGPDGKVEVDKHGRDANHRKANSQISHMNGNLEKAEHHRQKGSAYWEASSTAGDLPKWFRDTIYMIGKPTKRGAKLHRYTTKPETRRLPHGSQVIEPGSDANKTPRDMMHPLDIMRRNVQTAKSAAEKWSYNRQLEQATEEARRSIEAAKALPVQVATRVTKHLIDLSEDNRKPAAKGAPKPPPPSGEQGGLKSPPASSATNRKSPPPAAASALDPSNPFAIGTGSNSNPSYASMTGGSEVPAETAVAGDPIRDGVDSTKQQTHVDESGVDSTKKCSGTSEQQSITNGSGVDPTKKRSGANASGHESDSKKTRVESSTGTPADNDGLQTPSDSNPVVVTQSTGSNVDATVASAFSPFGIGQQVVNTSRRVLFTSLGVAARTLGDSARSLEELA